MLDKHDIEMLRGVIHEEVGEILEQVVLPRFEEIDGRFDGVESCLGKVESRLNRIEAVMVTKDYLDEKLALFKTGLENSAAWVARQVSRLAQELYHGGVLTAEQVIQIRID